MSIDLRRQKLIQILVENPEITLKDAMLSADYSEAYAGNPNQLTDSLSFRQELQLAIENKGLAQTLRLLANRTTHHVEDFEIDIPDEKLLDHAERLGAMFSEIEIKTRTVSEWVGTGKSKQWVDKEIEYKSLSYYLPDSAVVDRALDRLFKIRGDYAPEEHNHNLLTPFIKLIQKDDGEKNNLRITGGEQNS